ncbi:hypothetical protein [Pseudophaeobacter sp.]|uniref:hypothetical protein n=1 Tax=Pseudophaeobacter sp. TaxID=1971739 RepID=UPI0032974106
MANMVRLMIELSEEQDRRARGIFSDTQPYLQMALQAPQPVPAPGHGAVPAPKALACSHQQETPPAVAQSTATSDEATVTTVVEEERQKEEVFFEREGLKISVETGKNPPARVLDGSDGGVLELWDTWFEYKKKGMR